MAAVIVILTRMLAHTALQFSSMDLERATLKFISIDALPQKGLSIGLFCEKKEQRKCHPLYSVELNLSSHTIGASLIFLPVMTFGCLKNVQKKQMIR